MTADLGRRPLAEFVGTGLLVIFGAGALVAALEMGDGALDYAGLGIVALSFDAAKQGRLSIGIGLGWAKSHSFATGQCPMMRYHRQLMNAIGPVRFEEVA